MKKSRFIYRDGKTEAYCFRIYKFCFLMVDFKRVGLRVPKQIRLLHNDLVLVLYVKRALEME